MHIVVAGALVRGSAVLLCHRSPTRRWFPDAWDLPGGHVHRDESPPDALVRELAEELSVGVPAALLPVTPDFRVVEADLHLSVWRIDSWTGDPVNASPHEHDQIGWFDARSAASLPLAHSGYPSMLGALLARPSRHT